MRNLLKTGLSVISSVAAITIEVFILCPIVMGFIFIQSIQDKLKLNKN